MPRQLERPQSEMIPMHPHLISQLIADRQAGLMASARQQRLARQARAARRAWLAQRGRAAPMLAALGRLAWRRSSARTIQTPAGGPGQAAPTLTPRELGLLKLAAQGLTNPDIAQQFVLPRRGRGLGRAHRGSSENSERPRYKRRPPRLPTAQWRTGRAAKCDTLIA
jgi:hypothetical protein